MLQHDFCCSDLSTCCLLEAPPCARANEAQSSAPVPTTHGVNGPLLHSAARRRLLFPRQRSAQTTQNAALAEFGSRCPRSMHRDLRMRLATTDVESWNHEPLWCCFMQRNSSPRSDMLLREHTRNNIVLARPPSVPSVWIAPGFANPAEVAHGCRPWRCSCRSVPSVR